MQCGPPVAGLLQVLNSPFAAPVTDEMFTRASVVMSSAMCAARAQQPQHLSIVVDPEHLHVCHMPGCECADRAGVTRAAGS